MDIGDDKRAGGASMITEAAMDGAAANDHLDVLEYLHANSTKGCTGAAIVRAATNGQEEVVRWLLEHRATECLSRDTTSGTSGGSRASSTRLRTSIVAAMEGAAKNGHMAVVRLLHDRWVGSPSSSADSADTGDLVLSLRSALVAAAANGHLDTMKWLHRAVPMSDEDSSSPNPLADALNMAIRSRHLSVARWIQNVAAPHLQLPIRSSVLDVAMVAAAEHADFAMLEWIKAQRPESHFRAAKAPWASHACMAAVMRDHLEVLQWFSLTYTGGSDASNDTAWGRQECIRTIRGSQRVVAIGWLTWSERSVGPI